MSTDSGSRDPRLPSRPLKTFTGVFENVRLEVSHDEPDPPSARSVSYIEHYPLELGSLHILLNGVNASDLVPSSWLFSTLADLTGGLAELLEGISIRASWYCDPWQLDVKSNPKRNRAYLTLHCPGYDWVALRNVSVPLDEFGREVIKVSKQWLKYLDSLYHNEISEPERGQYFRNFQVLLEEAQQALRNYGAH
jgi:hypothetical protein